jgi:hypothetical protein
LKPVQANSSQVLVRKTLSQKYLTQKGLVERLQGVGPEFKSWYHKKKKSKVSLTQLIAMFAVENGSKF